MSQFPGFCQNADHRNDLNYIYQQQSNPQQCQDGIIHSSNYQGSSIGNQGYHPFETGFFINQQTPNSDRMRNPYQPILHQFPVTPNMQNRNFCEPMIRDIDNGYPSYINSSVPILILPNPQPMPQTQPKSCLMNCSQMNTATCSPYPISIPIYNHCPQQNSQNDKNNCECNDKLHGLKELSGELNGNLYNHKCKKIKEDTFCLKENYSAVLSLQALASQFLSIQGIISFAAIRLILCRIPGSNVTNNPEDVIAGAQKLINQMNKDQLLVESRNVQQINALISLHMTANPPPNIIPILTTIQLKINLLKAQVENLINKKLMEDQGIGGGTSNNLDSLVLILKTDTELRELLAALRQKECEERVNLNFAPYYSQRVIAESRLSNITKKISQVEAEMDRRRNKTLPTFSTNTWNQGNSPTVWYNSCTSSCDYYQIQNSFTIFPDQTLESPDPFIIQVRSPKRLNLKSCVGSPSTTYEHREDPESNEHLNNDKKEGLSQQQNNEGTTVESETSRKNHHNDNNGLSEPTQSFSHDSADERNSMHDVETSMEFDLVNIENYVTPT